MNNEKTELSKSTVGTSRLESYDDVCLKRVIPLQLLKFISMLVFKILSANVLFKNCLLKVDLKLARAQHVHTKTAVEIQMIEAYASSRRAERMND